MDLQVGGVSKAKVQNNGVLIISNNLEMSGSQIIIASQNRIVSNSSGVMMLINNGFSDFSRLQLGGTTSSFPAIKRNGTAIDFRLADDSGYCNIRGADATVANLIATAYITCGGAMAFEISAKGTLSAPSDGVFLLRNNANTDFNRLQFGGTTSSFPAIKRNGAGIDFRLADDSNYCDISAQNIVGATSLRAGGRIDLYGDGSSGVIGMVTLTNTLNLRKFVKIVGEGVLGANEASAVLQVDGTNRGFLPPRMTTAQKNAIATPATGLVVFDTTLAKLAVYTGAGWETITSI
jgi:hypothetical protein